MTAPHTGGAGSATEGRLVVVSTPIGNLGDLSARAVEVLTSADAIACEDTRHTRRLLSAKGIPGGGRLVAVHQHNEDEAAARLVERCLAGQVVALVSDAGTPGISDPGQRVVAAAVAGGVRVEAVPGASAALAALVVSGLPTERFCVEGFLPRKGAARRTRLAEFAVEPRTAVIYESPRRMVATLADLIGVCGPERLVSVSRELTKLYEETFRGTLVEASAWLGRLAAAGSSGPKGEFVIVIGGVPADRTDADPAGVEAEDRARDLAAAVARHLAGGMRTKDAAAAAATETGARKADAYAVALRLGQRDRSV